jgi:hypothetical protein
MNSTEQNARRKWRGWVEQTPEHPDTILSRHIAWDKGRKDSATSAYPEPINLVAAAAYQTRPRTLSDFALLYRDPNTQLWIQAVDIRGVTLDTANEWLEREKAQGAIAVWKNLSAEPLRPEPASKFKWEPAEEPDETSDENI